MVVVGWPGHLQSGDQWINGHRQLDFRCPQAALSTNSSVINIAVLRTGWALNTVAITAATADHEHH
ncbi:MAG: hypothetical protein E5X26_10990 [Mesorhizobium sp.]|nr:MAG: hypothetical protein E5X26_10990 [Mesorhizobium sp.]TIS12374.1 MAG: hypothetical protein E5X09_10695 [Mesorhizobium sp.]